MEYVFGDIIVAPTNTERVVYADAGITKGDVIAYYADVASVMLPELSRRPLTIERFTKGVDAGGFYQKHAQKHYPAWIDRVPVAGKTKVTYPICDTPAGLVYFANQGGFVFHVWTSRVEALGNPDMIVFDLDPPAGGLALVRQAAHLIRELLDAVGLPAFVKTSGSKGLHVVTPLDGAATYAQVEALCAAMSAILVRRHPDVLTQEFYKKDRKGRLFLDTMRNTFGATVVAPYSLRGKPGAPVSAPITWAEVDTIAPDDLKLPDIRARLDRIGDPWHALRATPGNVAAAAAALATLAP